MGSEIGFALAKIPERYDWEIKTRDYHWKKEMSQFHIGTIESETGEVVMTNGQESQFHIGTIERIT